MFSPWAPRFTNADPTQYAKDGTCCATIFGDRCDSWRCNRKASTTREHRGAVYGVCRQHSAESETARREKRDAEYRAQAEQRKHRWDAEVRAREFKDACVAAIKEIAAGHNDARGLALEVLATQGTSASG